MKKVFSALKKSFSLSGAPKPDARFAVDVPPPPPPSPQGPSTSDIMPAPPPPPKARLAMANGKAGDTPVEGTQRETTAPDEAKESPTQGFDSLVDRIRKEVKDKKAELNEAPEGLDDSGREVVGQSEKDTRSATEQVVNEVVENVDQVAEPKRLSTEEFDEMSQKLEAAREMDSAAARTTPADEQKKQDQLDIANLGGDRIVVEKRDDAGKIIKFRKATEDEINSAAARTSPADSPSGREMAQASAEVLANQAEVAAESLNKEAETPAMPEQTPEQAEQGEPPPERDVISERLDLFEVLERDKQGNVLKRRRLSRDEADIYRAEQAEIRANKRRSAEEVASELDEATAKSSPASGDSKEKDVLLAEVGSPEHDKIAEAYIAAGLENDITRAYHEHNKTLPVVKAESVPDKSSERPRPGRGQSTNKDAANKPFGEKAGSEKETPSVPAPRGLLDMEAELAEEKKSLAEKRQELESAEARVRPLESALLEEEIRELEGGILTKAEEVAVRRQRRDEFNQKRDERRGGLLGDQKKSPSQKEHVPGPRIERKKSSDNLEGLSSRKLEKMLRKREKETDLVKMLRDKAVERVRGRQEGHRKNEENAELFKNAMFRGPFWRFMARDTERTLKRESDHMQEAERRLSEQVDSRNRVVLVLENRLRDQLVEPEQRAEGIRTSLESAESLFAEEHKGLSDAGSLLRNLEDAATDPARHAEFMDRSWRGQVERVRAEILEKRVGLRERETKVLELRARLGKEESEIASLQEGVAEYVRRSRIPGTIDLITPVVQEASAPEPPPIAEPPPEPAEASPDSEDEDVLSGIGDEEDIEEAEDNEESDPRYAVSDFVEHNNDIIRTVDDEGGPELTEEEFSVKLEAYLKDNDKELEDGSATAEDLLETLKRIYEEAGVTKDDAFWEERASFLSDNEILDEVTS